MWITDNLISLWSKEANGIYTILIKFQIFVQMRKLY